MKFAFTDTPENRNLVKAMLSASVLSIAFEKASGEIREMKATTNSDAIPDTATSTSDKTPKAKNEEVQAVWDTQVAGWRSFRWDSLIDFSVNVT